MCRETAWLPVQARRQVDELMAGRLEVLGVKKLAGVARAHAQRLDQASAVEQMNRSVRERRVSVRPAPGAMAYLTALLPMAQAVGCLGALKKSAATSVGTGDRAERTQDQIMADLLVERITGQTQAEDLPVEIHLVMTDRSLWGGPETDEDDAEHRKPAGQDRTAKRSTCTAPPSTGRPVGGPAKRNQPDRNQAEQGQAELDRTGGSEVPAWLVGQGPLPAEVARRVITDTQAEVFIRRLYTEPTSGQLVAMDSKRRTFSGALRQLILVRDDTCRTPYCDAPVKHVDHVTPYRDGGATSAANASGLCARCNYTKEIPSWNHRSDGDRLKVTTPTGHHYTVRTPPLVAGAPPGPPSSRPPGRPAVPPENHPPQRPPESRPESWPELPPQASPEAWPGSSRRAQPDPVLSHVTYRPANSLLEQGMIQLLMTAAVARRAAASVGDGRRGHQVHAIGSAEH